ncbi:MAG: hypothetical protein E7266_08195 [Lachnospiraceae bacterium]|nr:hypothetical protein [Lachnospiraceae bacterium]
MKKIVMLAIMLIGVMVIGGCSRGNEQPKLEDSLSGIVDKIYAEKNTNLSLTTMNVNIKDANELSYYTGLSNNSKITEAVVSESALGSQAYSMVLVRLKDTKDAKEVANLMKDNINTRKWVCVGADDVRVAAYGDVVLFIMTSTEFENSASAKDITEAFKKVCGGNLAIDMAK